MYWQSLFILGILLLTSCNQIKYAEIVFPAPESQIKNPVILNASQKVTWKIDDKIVTEGISWKGILSSGQHNISIYVNETKAQSFNIKVQENFPLHQAINTNGLLENNKLSLPSGKFRVLLANINGEVHTSKDRNTAWEYVLYHRTKELLKIPRQTPDFRSIRSIENVERDFKMLSPAENGTLKISANKVFEGKHTLAYVDKSVSPEHLPDIIEIVQDFDHRIVHIDRRIFGEFSDVDANGRVILLFSDVLNKSEKAVGFFYAGDLLKRDASNPESNEAEILYLGIPDKQDANFSQTALKATACHELQHLINFSQKTLPYIEDTNAPLEEISVNEGLSHLAEDLCGFNFNGGNVVFSARYLKKAEQTSLDGLDLLYRGDTAERRGAMYLFLRYLFEYQGGAKFDANEIQDLGGMSWLHKITQSLDTGLENITRHTKTSFNQTLWNWWWCLALADLNEETWVPNTWKYLPMQYVPETQDFRGINLMLGEKILPPNIKFSLQGLPVTPIQHTALPKNSFQMLEFVGPTDIYVPNTWEAQVLRLQ